MIKKIINIFGVRLSSKIFLLLDCPVSRVSGRETRVLGVWSWDSGLGTRVSCLVSWVSGLGSQDPDLGSWVSGIRTRVSGLGHWEHPVLYSSREKRKNVKYDT